jgi:hypothetical protein
MGQLDEKTHGSRLAVRSGENLCVERIFTVGGDKLEVDATPFFERFSGQNLVFD